MQTILGKVSEEDPKAMKDRDAKSFVDDSLVKAVEDSGLTKLLYGR